MRDDLIKSWTKIYEIQEWVNVETEAEYGPRFTMAHLTVEKKNELIFICGKTKKILTDVGFKIYKCVNVHHNWYYLVNEKLARKIREIWRKSKCQRRIGTN